jgi:hypothetical protein
MRATTPGEEVACALAATSLTLLADGFNADDTRDDCGRARHQERVLAR